MELYEHIDKIIYIISSIITVLIGANGVLFYRINHGLKKTQLQREQSSEWEKLYVEEKNEVKGLTERMNDLYHQRLELFNEANNLKVQIAQKEVELARKDVEIAKIKFDRCIIPNCRKRVPKRDEEYATEINETQGANA